MKKKILVVVLLFISVGFTLVRWQYTNRLERHQLECEALKLDAQKATAAAIEFFNRGQYQLGAVLSQTMVQAFLEHLQGYEQLTRRGNRFVIQAISTEFKDGYIQVHAKANFDWRWGLYNGPIEIDYLVFAQINQQGGCSLHFRVENLTPLEPGFLFGDLLRPILIVNMQERMRLQDIDLPLTGLQPTHLPNIERTTRNGVEIKIPGREIQLKQAQTIIFSTREFLGILSTHPDDLPGDSPHQIPAGGYDMLVFTKTKFINQLLDQVFLPNKDLFIHIPRMERVWTKDHRFLGREVHSYADITDLNGVLDVIHSEITTEGDQLGLAMSLVGDFTGVVEADLAGIKLNVPVHMVPETQESIPLALDATDLTVSFLSKEIHMDLAVEADIRGFSVAFDHVISINPSEIIKNLALPGVLEPQVKIPSLVEKGQVLKKKQVDLVVQWDIELPLANRAGLLFLGKVQIQNGPSIRAQ